jgi:hypothetical protein
VNGLQLSAGSGPAETAVELRGWLELPRVVGISVVAGDPLDLDAVRGTGPAAPDDRVVVPVPVIPETC